MTGERQDPEQIIRDWLSDSAEPSAPVSLRDSVERMLSAPPSRGASSLPFWKLSRSGTARTFARLAAVLSVAAVIAGMVYLRSGSFGTTSPSSSPTARPTAAQSAGVSASALDGSVAPSLVRTPEVTQLAGSSWKVVDGALPELLPIDEWLTPSCPIFARAGGGFVAFVSTARPDRAVKGDGLGAPAPTAAATPAGPRETEVFTSSDGVTWTMASTLPTPDATVADMAEAAGMFVAVGWAGPEPPLGGAAEIWTSSDLRTWSSTDVSRLDGAPAAHVVYGPAGFLVWGVGNSETFPYDFWISKDGSDWQQLITSGLPNAVSIGTFDVHVLAGGYTIYDGTTVWQSTDAARWARAWAYTGPGASPKLDGDPFVALGPVFTTTSGGFVSFGRSGTVSGGPTPGPENILTWTSSDGIRWSPGKTNSFGVNLVFASGPDGFIAAGAQPAADDTSGTPWGKLAVWRTTDGHTWTPASDLPAVGSTDVLFNSPWLPGPSAVEVLGVVSDGVHTVIVCLGANVSTGQTGDMRGNLRLVVGR
jgi:hypothetical protein